MRLAIVGSREYTDYDKFKNEINNTLEKWKTEIKDIECIISGGAKGSDKMAERFAKENKIQTVIFKPDWITFGKAAGIMRNTDIINYCTHVIAFPSHKGKGTQDSIKKATDKKKVIEVLWID